MPHNSLVPVAAIFASILSTMAQVGVRLRQRGALRRDVPVVEAEERLAQPLEHAERGLQFQFAPASIGSPPFEPGPHHRLAAERVASAGPAEGVPVAHGEAPGGPCRRTGMPGDCPIPGPSYAILSMPSKNALMSVGLSGYSGSKRRRTGALPA